MVRRKQVRPPLRFECLFCDAQFRWNKDLEPHMNCHTRERPYDCDNCEANFNNPSSLGLHKRKVHDGRLIKCEVCYKIFRSFATLDSHRSLKHKIKPKKGRHKLGAPRKYVALQPKTENDGVVIEPHREREDEKSTGEEHAQETNCIQTLSRESEHSEPSLPMEEKGKKSEIPLPNIPSEFRKRAVPVENLRKARTNRFRVLEKIRQQQQQEWKSESSDTDAYELPEPIALSVISIPPNYNLQVTADTLMAARDRMVQINNNKWDPSFFLHMNRYDPADSVFYNGTPKKVVHENREMPKNNKQKFFGGGGGGSGGLPKKGRPRKKVEGVEDANHSLKLLSIKKVDSKDIERLDGSKAKCPYCGRIMLMNNITTHMLIHTGEKPFSCHFCKRSFRQKSHSIKHIARYHRYRQGNGTPGEISAQILKAADVVEEDDVSCAFCGKRCNDRVELEKHLLITHSDMFQPSLKSSVPV